MIQDNKSNTLFVSWLLKQRAPQFHRNLKKIIKQAKFEFKELPYTADIWCRDYMPIHLGENRLLKYHYNPDYLKPKKHRHRLTNQDAVIKTLEGFDFKDSSLVLDGGNVIKSENKVILTDKVITENYNLPVSQLRSVTEEMEQKIIDQIKIDLEVDEAIIIPRLPNDIFGHSDGMVRLLDDNTVLVNLYEDILDNKNYPETTKSKIMKLYKILKQNFTEVIDVPYYEYPDKYEGLYTADGCYINFLQMKDLVIMPVFNKRIEDNEAVEEFKDIFERRNIEVKTIDATEISKFGGVVNCATWDIEQY